MSMTPGSDTGTPDPSLAAADPRRPGTGPAVPRRSENIAASIDQLGISPGAKSGLIMLGSAGAIAVAGLMMAASGEVKGGGAGGSGILILLLLVIAIPVFLYSCIQFLVMAAAGGGGLNRTKDAIKDGRIGMSYLLGGSLHESYVVVDEDRRLLAVDGSVFGFDEVRWLKWQSVDGKGTLDFTLRSGEHPLRQARFTDQARLEAAYARLVNSLDLG